MQIISDWSTFARSVFERARDKKQAQKDEQPKHSAKTKQAKDRSVIFGGRVHLGWN